MFNSTAGIESVEATVSCLNRLDSMCNRLVFLRNRISLLSFWQENPDIVSVVVERSWESNLPMVTEIVFVSPEAEEQAKRKMFPQFKARGLEVEVYDLEDALGFTDLPGILNSDDVHTRPDNIQPKLIILLKEVDELLKKYIAFELLA